MWLKTFIVLLAFSIHTHCQDSEDEDLDYDDDDDWGEEGMSGMGMDPDFQNKMLDNLIETSIGHYPKTINVHIPHLQISDQPFLMTAQSAVFEDLHSIKRSSQVNIREEGEQLAHVGVHFKFDTFVVTYGDFIFTLEKFSARGTIKVRVLENEFYIHITGGKEGGGQCVVRANDINFTKLKKFRVDYYSHSMEEASAKCDRNLGVFRSFFGRVFMNAVTPLFTRKLTDRMNSFVKDIEMHVCMEEF